MYIEPSKKIGDEVTEECGNVILVHEIIGKDSADRFILRLKGTMPKVAKPVVEVAEVVEEVKEEKPDEKPIEKPTSKSTSKPTSKPVSKSAKPQAKKTVKRK